MYSARNRNAVIADDTFQIQDWLRSNGNHDRGYPEFDYYHRIRPLSPAKRHRISTTDGRGPDRRRQLKSMESLLGLSDENLNGKNMNSEAVTRASPDVQDSLDRALMDFEETLELAFQSNSIVPPPRGFSNHNLVEGDESNFNKLDSSFENNTTTSSSGYSTKPEHSMHRTINTYNELQLIREQMVKSLQIIKDLEEQVKMVPMLKAQVSSLNLEKQRLSYELDKFKIMENANKNTSDFAGGWSSPSSTLMRASNKRLGSTVTTKEVGINCVPMCRDVGVSTPVAVTSTASTIIASTEADRGDHRRVLPCVAAYTQTTASVKPVTRVAHTQTTAALRPTTAAVYTQTTAAVKPATAVAHTQTAAAVKPTTAAVHSQTASVASVQPTTTAVVVVKPPTVEVGTQSTRLATVRTAAVGVMARPRTYDACVTVKPTFRHVGCSADVAPVPVVMETEVKSAQPPPPVTVSHTTQTDPSWSAAASPHMLVTQQPSLFAVAEGGGGGTVGESENRTGGGGNRPVKAGRTIGLRSNSFHQYTAKDTTAAAATVAVSKIPRLKPATPELNRKVLTRQDTYTKTEAEICADRQPHVTDDSSGCGGGGGNDDDKAKDSLSLSTTPELQNGLPESEMNFEPIQDDMFKDNPSKEMKSALKVLHDSLKKTSATLLPRAQLKQAIDIVREEWFKVTSTSDSGGHLVKNYINWFTSYSPALLEFIINMTDAAGNTVLHYSISHGNFDTVSAILDTGVCNVNLTNDAGYSSVMLVSLAEIKNNDEMKIIKRLFKCGDVNLQAKKHGQTTLMLAVSHGKIEVVKLLLECGADLNMQDEDGSTALMCAAEHGLQEIINILLSCPECDVSIADNDGSTALSIAMDAGHREIGIALYAKQHILSRENSPFNLSKPKRSRSAQTVMPSNMPYSHLSLKKSTSLQPREYATLSSMLKTRTP